MYEKHVDYVYIKEIIYFCFIFTASCTLSHIYSLKYFLGRRCEMVYNCIAECNELGTGRHLQTQQDF